MQGKTSPDRQLLDAGAFCRGLVEDDSVYAFLADHREELFNDEDFADLFPSGRGRPSVPASVICTVMVLQALEGLSDRDAIRQLRTRIDWKVASGLALDHPGFEFTILTYWRTRLRNSDRPNRVFDAVRAVIGATGVLKKKTRRALDSTILDDAVATQDTVVQFISQIRRVRRLVEPTRAVALSVASDEGRKPLIDWSDEVARGELVTGLVTDASAVLEEASGLVVNDEQADALGLLALVAGQDVEPGEHEGTWRIARGVTRDRVISTVDPQARHGHKSVAVRKDGFKAHLCLEPDTGIVIAAQITPANAPDGKVGIELMSTEVTDDGEPARLEVLADSAYGSGPTRTALKQAGHRLVIKAMASHPAVRGGFVRDDFVVDHAARTVTCPAGHLAQLSRSGVAKFAPHCGSCPVRSRCTKAAARSFSVGEFDEELVSARAAWRTEELQATYRQHRPMAERTIAWLVAKNNRRLRYRGVEKNNEWLLLRVAALNLRRLVNLGLRNEQGWVLAST
ncbi:MAG: IS1182 family transposase [Acidimicrobiales bacterium]